LICVNGAPRDIGGKFDAAQKHLLRLMTSWMTTQMEETMPVDAAILSAVIITVFVIFGSVLYWGERRTRALSPDAEGAKFKRRAF
jgi:hypothetical protein